MTRNQEHAVLRKHAPFDFEQESQAPPSRPPPSAPVPHASTIPPPLSTTNHPHKLQKQGTLPKELPRLPASPYLPGRDGSVSPHNMEGRRRGNSLLPAAAAPGSPRSVSTPQAIRPKSANLDSELDNKTRRRSSWLPGKPRSRKSSQDLGQGQVLSAAWVSAGGHHIDYNLKFLVGGDKIPELWDESPEANMFVYLHPRETGRGPQIKCHSLVAQCSQRLLDIIHDNMFSPTSSGRARGRSFGGRDSLSIEDATRHMAIRSLASPPQTPQKAPDNQSVSDESGESIRSFPEAPRDLHLYYPTHLSTSGPQFSTEDIQKLVDARNLFAFFNGQPLVSTPSHPSIFSIFLAISASLKKFDFANQDGTTFGGEAEASFAFYLDEMRLADVRHSREKTVEALVLGERMCCPPLYNEAFAHAVGKFETISDLNLPIYDKLSSTTQLQLQQSARDLHKQEEAIKNRLTDFEFPSLFAGIGASTSSAESKIVRFKSWKANFLSLRKQVLSYYKELYGQWPPKASSKKNSLNEGGLNRLVLKLLYSDLCRLYDLLVDRTSLTTRGVDASEDRVDEFDISPAAALRKLLGEYDRSSPPVQPPIPFDTPLIPTMRIVEGKYNIMSPKEQNKLATRRLKEHEISLLLEKSQNFQIEAKSPFMEMYHTFERREGKGKNSVELTEQRFGHWIFLYAVIQSLPMLVTDAPGLAFTEGVEHFLCQIPTDPKPWLEDGTGVKRSWYNVQGGGVVSLPSHMVDYGVEAVYSRSHCWTVAQHWMGDPAAVAPVEQSQFQEVMSPLEPPPMFFGGGGAAPRSRSRGRERSASNGVLSPVDQNRSHSRHSQTQRRSIALGLERLPGHETLETIGGRPHSRSPSGTPGLVASRGPSPVPSGRRAASASMQGGVGPTSGSTFDDILGSMPQPVEKTKTKKLGFF